MKTVQNRVPGLAFLGSIHEGIPVRNEEGLQACVRFYTEVLGLKILPRPNLPMAGAWLGDEDNTVQFHLIVTDKDYTPGPGVAISATGRHTAWMVRDLEAFRERMRAPGGPYEERVGKVGSGPEVFKATQGSTRE